MAVEYAVGPPTAMLDGAESGGGVSSESIRKNRIKKQRDFTIKILLVLVRNSQKCEIRRLRESEVKSEGRRRGRR